MGFGKGQRPWQKLSDQWAQLKQSMDPYKKQYSQFAKKHPHLSAFLGDISKGVWKALAIIIILGIGLYVGTYITIVFFDVLEFINHKWLEAFTASTIRLGLCIEQTSTEWWVFKFISCFRSVCLYNLNMSLYLGLSIAACSFFFNFWMINKKWNFFFVPIGSFCSVFVFSLLSLTFLSAFALGGDPTWWWNSWIGKIANLLLGLYLIEEIATPTLILIVPALGLIWGVVLVNSLIGFALFVLKVTKK